MIIAQISDTHLLCTKERDPLALKRADNLERCVHAINELDKLPLAVVHTGDLINYSPENDYGLAREILAQLKVPLYPVVGNRDSRIHLIEHFLSDIVDPSKHGFCQYRVALEGVDLVAVDTKSDTRNIGTSCTARVEQVKQLLERDTKKPVFIFLHHPPAPVKALKNPLQFESMEHALAFSDLFDRYDNIVRILSGHTHRSDVIKVGRHTASTQPSLATDVRLDRYATHHTAEPVFQLHELHEDMTVNAMTRFAPAFAPAFSRVSDGGGEKAG